MIPVLQLDDPEAGADALVRHFGFVRKGELLEYGSQRLALTGEVRPKGFLPFAFDHLAICVGDVDATLARALASGARRHAAFTPQGPTEIAVFGPSGIRYAFCETPEGWPLEFCSPIGQTAKSAPRHDHFGWRVDQVDTAIGRLQAMGANLEARHSLGQVSVAFLRLGTAVFEVFDEELPRDSQKGAGWVGFLEE